jgi:hypothetical protein
MFSTRGIGTTGCGGCKLFGELFGVLLDSRDAEAGACCGKPWANHTIAQTLARGSIEEGVIGRSIEDSVHLVRVGISGMCVPSCSCVCHVMVRVFVLMWCPKSVRCACCVFLRAVQNIVALKNQGRECEQHAIGRE